MSIQSLINTSVDDCKISLEGDLQHNPLRAARDALDLLEALQGMEGQTSRRQVALRTLRAAAKRIAEDSTPDPKGPSYDDIYYTLPTADLRRLLEVRTERNAERIVGILTTLQEIRGEVQCETRRKILLAALRKTAQALAGCDERGRAS